MLGAPRVEYERAAVLLLNQLQRREQPKSGRFRRLNPLLALLAQSSARIDHVVACSKRATLSRSTSLSAVATPRRIHSVQASRLFKYH